MKLLSIAAACALFFAALITTLHTMLWQESPIALLLLAAVCLFLTTFIGARFGAALTPAPANTPAAAPDNRPRREDSGSRSPRKDGGRGRNTREDRPTDSNRERRPAQSPAPTPAPAGPREDGEVKWFNRTKGFGFIIRPNGDEIFVHQRAIRTSEDSDPRRRPILRDGQKVNYVVVERERGLQAEDVQGHDDS